MIIATPQLDMFCAPSGLLSNLLHLVPWPRSLASEDHTIKLPSPLTQLYSANGRPWKEMRGQGESACSSPRACYPSPSGVRSPGLPPTGSFHIGCLPLLKTRLPSGSPAKGDDQAHHFPITSPSFGPFRPLVATSDASLSFVGFRVPFAKTSWISPCVCTSSFALGPACYIVPLDCWKG